MASRMSSSACAGIAKAASTAALSRTRNIDIVAPLKVARGHRLTGFAETGAPPKPAIADLGIAGLGRPRAASERGAAFHHEGAAGERIGIVAAEGGGTGHRIIEVLNVEQILHRHRPEKV